MGSVFGNKRWSNFVSLRRRRLRGSSGARQRHRLRRGGGACGRVGGWLEGAERLGHSFVFHVVPGFHTGCESLGSGSKCRFVYTRGGYVFFLSVGLYLGMVSGA